MTFNKLGLKPEILSALEKTGYNKATPIQEQAIPAIMNGKDVLGGAQTGTGKTAAFALPILDRLSENPKRAKYPRALVITPTRELADQVAESFRTYGRDLKLVSTKIYGGVKINPQISALKNGTDIVIATPGRLLDHLNQGTIKLNQVEILVLDEADRMLDMGFINDIKKIIKNLPEGRQNLLFSATYSKDIKILANGVLKNPVNIEVSKRNTAADKVEQFVHHVAKDQRKELLAHLIQDGSWYQALVFVKMKHGANRLAQQLNKLGIPSAAIHGDKSQGARTRALKDFKKGDIQALIATDVAARGLQIDNLDYVVNFDLPQVPEDYVHRIGRTGRAGKSGKAVSLVHPEDKKQLQRIEKLLKYTIDTVKVEGFEPLPFSEKKEERNYSAKTSSAEVKVKPDRKRYLTNKSRQNNRKNNRSASGRSHSRSNPGKK